MDGEDANMDNANITLVQGLYGAFTRGDIATLIEGLTPDVEWISGGRKEDFPVFGVHTGRHGVQQFFAIVADTQDFTEFAPHEYYADGDKVIALGHYTATIKKTGRSAASDWAHVFTIRGGKVSRFHEFTDTARFAEAYRG